MFWIALATQAATAAAPPLPPPPQHPVGLFVAEDYPSSALDRGEQGAVYWQVIVNPQGRVENCRILGSSGYKDLDDTTCRLVTTRARFSPARDQDNKPIYSTYRAFTNWSFGGPSAPPSIAPNLDLTINQAPAGLKLPIRFTVRYFVTADGKVSHCHSDSDSAPLPQSAAPQVLVDLACNALTQSPLQIVRNQKNEPVDASDTATVRFSLGKDGD